MRTPKRTRPATETALPAADAEAVVQIKIWLLGISPMVWRRVLVPSSCSLRELHGVIQIAMGWEGIHLYQFCLRAARYGSRELSASSPEVTLIALQLRTGSRFVYEYDLNIPWRHEVRIEKRMEPEHGKAYPLCIGGNGACPPEDCGGPEAYLAGLSDTVSITALEDLDAMAEIIGQVVRERRADLLDDEETRWRLERAVERSKARERAQGRPFSRRMVNTRLRKGEHLDLMHQQY
jgi:hypothetical protein